MESSRAIRFWLHLSLTEGIGPILTQRLIDATGGAQQACQADASVLRGIEGIGAARSRQIHESLRRAAGEVDAELARASEHGARIICREDDDYPTLLRSIPDPPCVLYVRGALEPRDLNGIAIVGSRRCSHYGREQAERFAALLAGAGMTVISGGARGIDSAAHRGAMSHPHGRTIAVLGSGVDVAYPPENASLFDKIAEHGGAVVSEYPFGTAPVPENFPRRNRIVSGMSRGVLVIEADEKSGALITARMACDDHGRPVFALPGRVDNAMSAGPHLLIRQGAALVARLEDILDNLDPLPQQAHEPHATDAPPMSDDSDHRPGAGATVALSERQSHILSHFDHEAVSVDRIVDRAELPANIVLQELTFLSLKGLVKRVDGQTFARAGNKGA